MVKYYCNLCSSILLGDKVVVAVKNPDGTQLPTIHLCKDCYAKLQALTKDMHNEEKKQELVTVEKDEICEKTKDSRLGEMKKKLSIVEEERPAELVEEEKEENTDEYTEAVTFNGIRIKDALPGKPRSKNDIPKIRSILIDFYRNMQPKISQHRFGMSYQVWYRWVSKYASSEICSRYGNYKRFCEPGAEKAIDTDKVLTLAAGLFPITEIAKEVGCNDENLIDEILFYYTGV